MANPAQQSESGKVSSLSCAKFINIESLRFLFAIIIVYFHLMYNTIIGNLYTMLRYKAQNAYLIVEFFFIIAGFFLFQTFKNNKKITWAEFAFKKVTRLWPLLAFQNIILIVLVYFNFTERDIYNHFLSMVFLHNMGIVPVVYGVTWFVSAYFWATLFYFYILKHFDIKYANLIIALCTYFSFVGIFNFMGVDKISLIANVFCGFFNAGFLRAIASIGIGYFAGVLYSNIKKYIDTKPDNLKIFTIASIMETICIVSLFKYTLDFEYSKYNQSVPFVLLVFLIFFLLALFKKGTFTKMLDNKYLAFLGRYSYSIYVMQLVAFCILQNTLWKSVYFMTRPTLCLVCSLTFSIILGIFTYYLVEKPFCNFLNKKINSTKTFLKEEN